MSSLHQSLSFKWNVGERGVSSFQGWFCVTLSRPYIKKTVTNIFQCSFAEHAQTVMY